MARMIRCDRCGHQEATGGSAGVVRFTELYFEADGGETPTDLCADCTEDVRAFVADSRAGGLRVSLDNVKRIILDAGLSIDMDRPEHAVASLVVQRDTAVRQLEALRKTHAALGASTVNVQRAMGRAADRPTEADRII